VPARKAAALPSAPESTLLAEAADLAARIEAIQQRLQAALLMGETTVAIRADLADLNDRADAVSAELIRVAGQVLDRVNAEIEAAARIMADGLEVRLAALVAGLLPPPAPV
jgi:hypothetical protein